MRCPSSVSRLSRRPCLKFGFEKVEKVSYWFTGPQKLNWRYRFKTENCLNLTKTDCSYEMPCTVNFQNLKDKGQGHQGINVSLSICMYKFDKSVRQINQVEYHRKLFLGFLWLA